MNLPAPRLTGYIPHVPTPRQHAALLLDHRRELLYGGAAGGGKSDFLLMAALQYVDVPGYASLLLRRTFAELSQAGALLPRAQEWLEPTRATGAETVNGYPTRWDFPSGAKLELGHMQHEKDRFQYKGGEYQFIGFDELTGFTQPQYRYLFSRLRRLKHARVPIRMRAASNPGDVGHQWVCDRFVDRTDTLPHEERPVFLPSKLADNPYLDADEYAASLGHLFKYERDQLLDGDWHAHKPGLLMQRGDFKITDPGEIRCTRELRFWDLAGTKAKEQDADGGPAWTAGVRAGTPRDKRCLVIQHVDRFRENHAQVRARIVQRAAMDGAAVGVRMEQEPGSSGKAVVADMKLSLRGHDFRGIPSTGDKIVRARPFINDVTDGEVYLERGDWNEAFLREMESVTVPPSSFMDQFDAAAAAHKELMVKGGISLDDLYPEAA